MKKITRAELIKELAKHAHPTWFRLLLEINTPHLKRLLAYYKGV